MRRETCDYCFDYGATSMIVTGRTSLEGEMRPTIKLWCGNCDVDVKAETDLGALQEIRERFNV